MKVIDDSNGVIPEEVLIALQEEWYAGSKKNEDRFASVTMLMMPPKMFWGIKKHESGQHEITASRSLYSLEGHINHYFFERVFGPLEDFKEEFEVKVNYHIDGRQFVLTGHSDLVNTRSKTLVDWKNLNVGKYQKGEFGEFETQTNMYAYFINGMNQKGFVDFQIENIKIIGKLRDWSAMELIKKTKNYPKYMFVAFKLNMWSPNTAKAYIDNRLRTLLYYENYDLDQIPECSPEERWQKETTYPVFNCNKDGEVKEKARACSGTANFKSPEQGEKWIEDRIRADKIKKKSNFYTIKKRSSFPTRCAGYCDVSRNGLCNWWNEHRSEYGC